MISLSICFHTCFFKGTKKKNHVQGAQYCSNCLLVLQPPPDSVSNFIEHDSFFFFFFFHPTSLPEQKFRTEASRMSRIRSVRPDVWFLGCYTFFNSSLHATRERWEQLAAHNWAILLLSWRFLWELGGRRRKTQAWPWRQTGAICCTYPQARTLRSPISMNSLHSPSSLQSLLGSPPPDCGTCRHY